MIQKRNELTAGGFDAHIGIGNDVGVLRGGDNPNAIIRCPGNRLGNHTVLGRPVHQKELPPCIALSQYGINQLTQIVSVRPKTGNHNTNQRGHAPLRRSLRSKLTWCCPMPLKPPAICLVIRAGIAHVGIRGTPKRIEEPAIERAKAPRNASR